MTFPGESLSVDSFTNVSGSPVGSIEAIRLRAGSSTFTAGDSVELSSGLIYRYLAPGDAAVVSWVVEVLSGSATFTLSEGIGNTATSLGSRTVTGPAQVVVPSTAITPANVIADTDARLLLTCTSGAVDVQQVKLRVWPPGGVAGGWSDPLPGFDTSPQDAQVRYLSPAPEISGSATGTDPETVWNDAYAAFTSGIGAASAAAPRTTAPTAPGTSRARQGMSKLDLAPTYAADHSLIPLGVLLYGVDWRNVDAIAPGLVEGVDWIVPPNEVSADVTLRAQQLGTGSTAWLNAVATAPSDPGTMPGGVTVTSVGGDYTPTGPSLDVVTLPLLHGGAGGAVTLDTSGRDIYVSVSHELATGAAATWPGWVPGAIGSGMSREETPTVTLGVGGAPVRTYATMPPYRVWSPTAVRRSVVRHGVRNDGLRSTAPRRWGQESSYQSGRVGGHV